MGMAGHIRLTNSVNGIDLPRLKRIKDMNLSLQKERKMSRFGRILVVKSILDKKITEEGEKYRLKLLIYVRVRYCEKLQSYQN